MASVLDNLKANMAQQGMLTSTGRLPRWLDYARYQYPEIPSAVSGVINPVSVGSDSDASDAPIKAWEDFTPEEKYIDSTEWFGSKWTPRTALADFALGKIPGMTTLTDYELGKNVGPDLASMGGSFLGGTVGTDMLSSLGYSALGGMGSEMLYDYAAQEGYVPGGLFNQDKYSGPGAFITSKMKDVHGFEAVPQQPFDKLASDMTGLYNNNDISAKELMDIEKQVAFEMGLPHDPSAVEVVDKSNWTQADWDNRTEESVAFNDRGSILTLANPTSVDDFSGMFSKAGDAVSNWFSGLTQEPTGLQYQAPKIGYGKEGDDTWQDSKGTTYHGSGYDWNNSDESSSTPEGLGDEDYYNI